MLAPANALPLAVERAGEPPWQERSVQDRCNVSEFNRREIGRAAAPPHNHSGTVVVAGAWLAFYVVAAIQSFWLSAIEPTTRRGSMAVRTFACPRFRDRPT